MKLAASILAVCLTIPTAANCQYLEATVPVGASPHQILWNSRSNKVYCANEQDASVTVISGETNQVLATVGVADYPVYLCYNSVANKVYCSSGESNRVNVIDGAGDSLIRRIHVSGWPSKMAFDASLNKLYVICYDDRMVRVFDGSADTLVAEVGLGDRQQPYGILWHPTTNRVFCLTGDDGDTVFVIDCVSDQIVERRPVVGLSWLVCRNPVNDLVYVAARYAIHVFTPSGDSEVARIPGYAGAICPVPFPNKLYAVRSPGLSVIDCYTHTVVDSMSITVGEFVCDTARGKVYSICGQVLDARADTLLKTIPLGTVSSAICWNTIDSRVYITDYRANAVYVIRDTSSAVTEPSSTEPERLPRLAALARGGLWLTGGGDADMFSGSGARVAGLRPGQNNLAALRPGAYFVRMKQTREVHKLILVR